MVKGPLAKRLFPLVPRASARGRKNRTMNDRLDELKATIKSCAGRLIGNGRLERGGQADLALARARRKTKSVLRQVGGSFKEGLGRMTHHERLVAQGNADRLHGQAGQSD